MGHCPDCGRAFCPANEESPRGCCEICLERQGLTWDGTPDVDDEEEAPAARPLGWRRPDSGAYIPTPDEIRAGLAVIRAGWSRREEMKRRNADARPFTVPELKNPNVFERKAPP